MNDAIYKYSQNFPSIDFPCHLFRNDLITGDKPALQYNDILNHLPFTENELPNVGRWVL